MIVHSDINKGRRSGRLKGAAVLSALMILLAPLGMDCTADDSGDQQSLAALVALGLSGCNLGGAVFSVGSGVTCSGGTASGSGTLTAVASSGDFLSLQLSLTLQSGGTLEALGGNNNAGSSGVIARGFGVAFSNSGATAVGPSDSSGNAAAFAASAGTTVVFCVETHYSENPPHIIAKSSACPSGTEAASSQAIDDESRSGSASTNRGWGFILSNATISGVSFNDSEKFTE